MNLGKFDSVSDLVPDALSSDSSLVSDDWRVLGAATDVLYALDTLESIDDFTGRAAIYGSSGSEFPIPVDFLVQNVEFSLMEHVQVGPHIGESFGCIAFGKAPLMVNINGILPLTHGNPSRENFYEAYTNQLRASAVARTGVLPVFRCTNAVMSLVILSMTVSYTSRMQSVCTVDMTGLVFRLSVGGILFDYQHGENNSMYLDRTLSKEEMEKKKKEEEEKKKEAAKKKEEAKKNPAAMPSAGGMGKTS